MYMVNYGFPMIFQVVCKINGGIQDPEAYLEDAAALFNNEYFKIEPENYLDPDHWEKYRVFQGTGKIDTEKKAIYFGDVLLHWKDSKPMSVQVDPTHGAITARAADNSRMIYADMFHMARKDGNIYLPKYQKEFSEKC